jgi:hypothetical protein
MGLAAVLVAVYFVYKTAKENCRSHFLWSALAIAVGLGTQIVFPLLIVLALVICYRITGTPPSKIHDVLDTPAEVITIICIPLSVISVLGILRFVARIPPDGPIRAKANELSIYGGE